MKEEECKDVYDSMFTVGKEITVNLIITDQEKASDLMSTLYGRNEKEFGVVVQSWGFWDIQKAEQNRCSAIKDALYDLQALLDKPGLDLLNTEDDKDTE